MKHEKIMFTIRSACLVSILVLSAMWSDILSPSVKAKNTLTERKETCMTVDNLPDTVSKEIRKPLMPTNLTSAQGRVQYVLASSIASKNRGKTIAITEIVKDERMLAFICHNQVLARAKWVQDKTGLSVAAVLGQKYSESGGGTSTFCAMTKNLSNIKCNRKECKAFNIRLTRKGQVGSKTSHCIQLYDDRSSDRFIRFDYLYKGWEEYAALINSRYHRAAAKKNVLDEVKGLKAGGFATNPRYVALVYGKIQHTGLLLLQEYVDKGYTITSRDGKYVLL